MSDKLFEKIRIIIKFKKLGHLAPVVLFLNQNKLFPNHPL